MLLGIPPAGRMNLKPEKITYFAVMNTKSAFWRRLSGNKGAVFGMIVIIIALFLAVFAYFIAPDSSHFANRMVPELANKQPGFSMQVVRLKKPGAQAIETSFFEQLISGKPDAYQYVPVTSYAIKKDILYAEKFVDEGISEPIQFPLSNLAAEDPVGTIRYPLGSDRFGRDIASRLIVGTRVSLSVGFIAVILSLTIGLSLGSIAGYFGGKIDSLIMWLINIIWSIPTLLLVFALTLLLGKGFWQVFIAVGLTMWVNVARLVRGQVLAMREFEFVEASRALGFSNSRIIVRHILPNISGPVMVLAANNFAAAILIEAGLSFLGIGVQPPQPSWGLMIKENYNFIITSNPMLALEPGIAIMLLVLAFNLLGNGLRDAISVK